MRKKTPFIRLFALFIVALCFNTTTSDAQQVVILAVNGKRCAGDSAQVVWDATGSYNAANRFVIEIDTNNFGTGTSIFKLDSLLSNKSGKDSMWVHLPKSFNKSNKYRFRILATDPPMIGAISPAAYSISNVMKPAAPAPPVVTKASCPKARDGAINVSPVPGFFAPLNFFWQPPLPPVPNPINVKPGMYYVKITDANGCDTTLPANVGVLNTLNASASGTITANSLPITTGKVLLLPHDSAKKIMLDTIVDVDGSGVYSIPNRPPGKYIVLARADSLAYPNTIKTYSGNTHRWDSAQVFLLTCNSNDLIDIDIISLTPPTGKCKIKGRILEGDGFGKGPGDPIPGLSIGLEIYPPGGQMTAQSTTDTNGVFEFNNVNEGGYKMHVEIPGLPVVTTYNINISSQDSLVEDLNFIADSAKIFTEISASVKQIKGKQNNIKGILYDPFTGSFIFKYSNNNASTVNIVLHDMAGKKVFETSFNRSKGEHRDQVNAGHLSSGVYLLNIRYGEQAYTAKVLLPEAGK